MPETTLCLLGKQPKILSFIDCSTNKYITLKVNLKESISEFELMKFFNRIYRANLDNGYSRIFQKNYSTKNLKASLCNILKEPEVINLEELYELLNKENYEDLLVFELIMKEFLKMFDIKKETEFTLKEYNEMVRQQTTNSLFNNEESNFQKETSAMKYNSYFLNKEYILNAKKKEEYKTLRLVKPKKAI